MPQDTMQTAKGTKSLAPAMFKAMSAALKPTEKSLKEQKVLKIVRYPRKIFPSLTYETGVANQRDIVPKIVFIQFNCLNLNKNSSNSF